MKGVGSGGAGGGGIGGGMGGLGKNVWFQGNISVISSLPHPLLLTKCPASMVGECGLSLSMSTKK